MKPGDALIEAARKQAEGEVAVHIANIKVYQTMPAGIGEHSDITEAVIEELNKLAAANDRLEMIQKYIEDLIAENLVSDKIKQGDKLLIDHKPEDDHLTLLINKKEIAS